MGRPVMDDEFTKMERMYATSFYDVMMDHHYRYHFALSFIRRGDVVLDSAYNSGYGTHYMAKNSECALAVGVDRSEHALNWALDHFTCDNTVYVKADLSGAFDMELPVRQYDVVACFETVEHMQNDQAFIRKLYDVMKTGGVLLISAPNENVIPHLNNPYFPNGFNPHHYRHYRPEELQQLVTACGFKIEQKLTQDNATYELVPGRDDGFTTVLVATKL
jgi:2-polyprenyl-3-methyl-5-hydroxy-6-metoxy-1,4-benzoquinol methylase